MIKFNKFFLITITSFLMFLSGYSVLLFIPCVHYSGFLYNILVNFSLAMILSSGIIFSVMLFREAYKFEKNKNNKLFVRLLIYCSVFLFQCLFASTIIPQPGGIGLVARILSPIMGPWSRFLPPNAMASAQCTMEYCCFSFGLTLSMLIVIPFSLCAKNKICRYISMPIGLALTLIWTGYGILRIFMDVM